MDRRSALKNLSLTIGYAVSAPTLLNMLSSCTADIVSWEPVFFTKDEQQVVIHLVDIMMPSSKIPGGLDVNVPQFIDKMYKDVETESKQSQFRAGALIFADKFELMFGKNILKGNKDEVSKLFASYFDLSKAEQSHVIQDQKKLLIDISVKEKNTYLIYKFLFSIRAYSLYGYFTSEKVGKEVLNYDPVPGVYKGCVPLEEIGNSWSL